MFYLAEISCAINGIFIAEKLLLRPFKEKRSKTLTIFGKFFSPILMIFSYMSRYLFLDNTLKNMSLLAHMCIGLFWGFFLGSTSYYAKARIAKRKEDLAQ
ncbi:MAG TPA: hypothetical protein DC024_02965 [Clostridiales bacterium]|jgi:hypothetical protein|nr:hypothetical protein [Clostridiales bacterium]HCS10458.1 hypothetical protein [Clostridiales bacterium]